MKEKKVGRPEQRFKIDTTFDNAINVIMNTPQAKTNKHTPKTENKK